MGLSFKTEKVSLDVDLVKQILQYQPEIPFAISIIIAWQTNA